MTRERSLYNTYAIERARAHAVKVYTETPCVYVPYTIYFVCRKRTRSDAANGYLFLRRKTETVETVGAGGHGPAGTEARDEKNGTAAAVVGGGRPENVSRRARVFSDAIAPSGGRPAVSRLKHVVI